MAEHRIQSNVLACVNQLWEKEWGRRNKITNDKYKSLNTAVQKLGLDLTIMKEEEEE